MASCKNLFEVLSELMGENKTIGNKKSEYEKNLNLNDEEGNSTSINSIIYNIIKGFGEPLEPMQIKNIYYNQNYYGRKDV
jgi:hypothetical protein